MDKKEKMKWKDERGNWHRLIKIDGVWEPVEQWNIQKYVL